MKFIKDPRVGAGRRCLALAWLYYTLYLAALMIFSYTLGIKPFVWGLPRWVAIGNIVIPILFVVGLIFVAERFIPDIPLSDNDEPSEKSK